MLLRGTDDAIESARFLFFALSEAERINCPISDCAYNDEGGIGMSDRCHDIARCGPEGMQQAMSIHTKKITDSCRDKDCIEDLRVYLTAASQHQLDSAAGAKVRCADLLYAYIDVETHAC